MEAPHKVGMGGTMGAQHLRARSGHLDLHLTARQVQASTSSTGGGELRGGGAIFACGQAPYILFRLGRVMDDAGEKCSPWNVALSPFPGLSRQFFCSLSLLISLPLFQQPFSPPSFSIFFIFNFRPSAEGFGGGSCSLRGLRRAFEPR